MRAIFEVLRVSLYAWVSMIAACATDDPSASFDDPLDDATESEAMQASTSCTPIIGCSVTQNNTGAAVYVARDWCNHSGTDNQHWFSETPPCGPPSVTHPAQWIPGHSSSPSGDWDVFRVDAGWCYKVHWDVTASPDHDTTYNRSNAGSEFVRVENNERAIITFQRFGTCSGTSL
jgi:hypothetical protein